MHGGDHDRDLVAALRKATGQQRRYILRAQTVQILNYKRNSHVFLSIRVSTASTIRSKVLPKLHPMTLQPEEGELPGSI
jgi:hypothetical protein